MGDDIKPDVIKRTQESLGKYIKKPPLTEKLLKKPPFRFLHDIITAMIRETGFLEGLFSSEELSHENIKDRDGKVAFLQKVIDAVKAITGANLTVRPTKIVAGHEPAKTNELLQAIGKALDKKLNSKEYIESLQKKSKNTTKATTKESKTTTGLKPSQARARSQDRTKNKEPEKKKPVAKSSGDTNTRTSKTRNETPREKPKKETTVPVEVPKSEPTQPEESAPVTEAETKRPQSARPGHRKASANPLNHAAVEVEDAGGDGNRNNEEPRVLGSPQIQPDIELVPTAAEVEKILSPTPKPEPPTVPKSARPRPQTALRPPSARPPSARPAAPRIRDRGEVRVPEELSSSPVTGKVNVITENESITEQDEDENFIVVESQTSVLIQEEPTPVPSTTEPKPVPEGEHGHLVAQILETQKELEEDSKVSHQDGQSKKVEIEWEAGRHRERELASREVERLRGSIQTLTRAANPLGKLMDFLQEDVDSMQRELEMWRRTNMELVAELRAEQSQTQSLTEPLKHHLQQLETSIEEQLNQLSAMKATVLRNDERISKLLTGQPAK